MLKKLNGKQNLWENKIDLGGPKLLLLKTRYVYIYSQGLMNMWKAFISQVNGCDKFWYCMKRKNKYCNIFVHITQSWSSLTIF